MPAETDKLASAINDGLSGLMKRATDAADRLNSAVTNGHGVIDSVETHAKNVDASFAAVTAALAKLSNLPPS